MVEKKFPLPKISIHMNRVLSSDISFEDEILVAPKKLGDLTIVNIINARDKEEHIKLSWLWNESA